MHMEEILVEGGGEVGGAFLDNNLVNRIAFFYENVGGNVPNVTTHFRAAAGHFHILIKNMQTI